MCQALVQDIVFPLMCHTDEDEELWESDPIEYIRVKYGRFVTSPSLEPCFCTLFYTILKISACAFNADCLQCFDTVGWAAGRASGL